jgi:Protein of unknown function (DUF1566)
VDGGVRGACRGVTPARTVDDGVRIHPEQGVLVSTTVRGGRIWHGMEVGGQSAPPTEGDPPMRLSVIVLLVSALALPAGARSKRKQCKHLCSDLIATCTSNATAAGFGNLTKGCRHAILKRCRKEGVAVCGGFCGNGTVDGTEACDGTALGDATCTSVGFASGALACTVGCRFDTSGCTPSGAPTCGNGTVEPPEQCDGAELGGASCGSLGFTLGGTLGCTAGCAFDVGGCASQRFPASGQTVAVMADKNDGIPGAVIVADDGTIQAGQSLAYVDSGDGTITDMSTGLMWEKKDRAGGLHDKDNTYLWSGNGAEETIWDWLDDVNAEGGTGFAGHNDWRIPNVKELQSLVSYGRGGGGAEAIEPAFNTNCVPMCAMDDCSCTDTFNYWSATTDVIGSDSAWFVSFSDGHVGLDGKGGDDNVRAVRSGQ